MTTANSGDAAADIILDFVAKHESTGNYNAYFGNAKSTSPDFATMTLAQIYDFQGTMLSKQAAAGSKIRSTALGRYQFLRDTLMGLQRRFSLEDINLFTPGLQDKFGLALLKRRGFDDWRASNDPQAEVEFARLLSMEWASLPDPEKGGTSHYAGQRASASMDEVYAMLREARAAITPPAPIPAPPVNQDALSDAIDALERALVHLRKLAAR